MKSSTLFLIILLPASSCRGMEHTQITAPYTPHLSFKDKYPIATRTINSTGLGLTTGIASYTLNKLIQSNHSLRNSILIGSAIAIGSYLYQKKYTKFNYLDWILCDPAHTFQHLKPMRKSFYAQLKKDAFDSIPSDQNPHILLDQRIKKAEQHAPYLLLSECDYKDENGSCTLSRSSNPQFRKHYENTVANALLTKLQKSKDAVSYVSFGCGEKFQDLVILTKALSQKPDAHLKIHLIDSNEMRGLPCNLLFNDFRVYDHYFDATALMPELIKRAPVKYKKQNHPETQTDRELEKKLHNDLIISNALQKEFLRWLTYTFPHAKIELYVYDSAAQFISHHEDKNLPTPDVVCTIDTDDDDSVAAEAEKNYMKLCSYSLSKKPNCYNFCMYHNFPLKPAHILIYSLKPTVESIKIESKDKKLPDIFQMTTTV